MATYYVRTTGNDTTGDGSTGTPWATPGKAVAAGLAAGDVVNIGPGTYTLSTSTPGAGGPVAISGESEDSTPIIFQAEDSNDKPIIDVGAITSISVFSVSNYGGALRTINIVVDGQSNSNVTAFNMDATSGSAYRCKAIDCTVGFGPSGASGGVFVECEASGCVDGYVKSALATRCIARDGTRGFSTESRLLDCISYGNSSYGFYSAGADSGRNQFLSCIAFDNGGDGFRIDTYNRNCLIQNCIAVSNGGYGFNRSGAAGNGNSWLLGCAGYNNTSGNVNGYTTGITNIDFVTLTADPFVDAASGDFNINNDAGGGADLRAVTLTIGA